MRPHTEFLYHKLKLLPIFQGYSWRLRCEGGGMGFISAESRRQTRKWKIIPIERLIIIIIIILFSFQPVCSERPFHRDMNGSNELSHILFQILFLPLLELQPRTPHSSASSFRQETPNRFLQPIVCWHTSGNQEAYMCHGKSWLFFNSVGLSRLRRYHR